jgi:hypothetical protein
MARDEGGSDNRYEKLNILELLIPGALKHIKDFTTVIDALSDDENNPENRCVIETEELKNLILVWHQLHRLDTKQRDTDAIRRVSASMTDQPLEGNALSNEVREAS